MGNRYLYRIDDPACENLEGVRPNKVGVIKSGSDIYNLLFAKYKIFNV